MLKQLLKPLDENDIFLSTATEQITWKELDDNLDKKIEKLKEHGIGPHVIFVIQENDKTTLDDLLWILASVKNGGSSSNAESSMTKKELDFLIRDSNANCVIRSNNIEIVKDPALGPTILHPNEIFRGMTSGTTVKEMFEIYPYFWTEQEHYESEVDGKTLLGCTTGSGNRFFLNIAPEMARDERAILIQASGFVSTYAPYNLLRTYQLGGRFHFLNNGDDIAHEVEKVKPNCIMSFPNAVKRIVDALPEGKSSIRYFELSGGHTPEPLVRDIERKCNLVAMYNMFASTEMDCVMHSEYRPGESLDNFYGFTPPTNTPYDLKIDEGILWYKYGNLDWRTDYDKFVEKDGKWWYNGRANDDFLIVKQGVKIYTGIIEGIALDVEGVESASSCEEDKLHYLIYTGDADINKVASKLEELQRWKRPHEIYHVTDKLYYSGTKVQRRKLPGIVKSANTGIISHINFKDHNLI